MKSQELRETLKAMRAALYARLVRYENSDNHGAEYQATKALLSSLQLYFDATQKPGEA